MTYQALETSVRSGAPAEFYRFVRGAEAWYFTNSAEEQTVAGIVYRPVNVSRTPISRSSEQSASTVEVFLPSVNSLALTLVSVAAVAEPLELTLMSRHYDDVDLEAVTIFLGTAGACVLEDGMARISFEDINARLENPQTRIYFQSRCPYVLYDESTCKVSRAAFANPGTVAAVGPGYVDVAGIGNVGPTSKYYENGIVRVGSEQRFVQRQEGNRLYYAYRFSRALVVGETVTAYAGCDLSPATCQSRFANEANFGGFPQLPTNDPWRRV